MTTANSPLTLTINNGRQVVIDQAKTILQLGNDSDSLHCAILRGPHGAAIFNPQGRVLVNGVASSAHWLTSGDRLEFPPNFLASVDQLGTLQQALNELESTSAALTPESVVDDTSADPGVPPQPAPSAPVQVDVSSPVLESTSDQFNPATDATSHHFSPATDATSETFTPETFTPVTEAVNNNFAATSTDPVATAPATIPAPPQTTPTMPEPAEAAPAELTGLAAELLQQIRDEAEPTDHTSPPSVTDPAASAPTHSAAVGDNTFDSELNAPANDLAPLQDPLVVPEQPPSERIVSGQESPVPAAEQPIATSEPSSDTPPTEHDPNSVAALLARLKSEGQWDGIEDDHADSTPASTPVDPPAAPQPEPESVATTTTDNQCDNDVENYMSQLLNRMRGGEPAAAPTVAPVHNTPTPTPTEVPQEVAVEPKEVMRPEEFVPKTVAKRVDGWQGMRELANSQARTAIDRSQVQKRKKSVSTIQLLIGLVSGAISIFFVAGTSLNLFSAMTACVCGICSGFSIYKAYTNILDNEKKPASVSVTRQNTAPQPLADNNQQPQ